MTTEAKTAAELVLNELVGPHCFLCPAPRIAPMFSMDQRSFSQALVAGRLGVKPVRIGTGTKARLYVRRNELLNALAGAPA